MLSPSIPYTPPTTLNHTQKSKNKKQAKENTCSQANSDLHLVPPFGERREKERKQVAKNRTLPTHSKIRNEALEYTF
ncbi:hypothetical protein V8C40DRAFT_25857 [Trichoderma camerunense]